MDSKTEQTDSLQAEDDIALAEDLIERYARLRAELGKLIVGQDAVVEQVMLATPSTELFENSLEQFVPAIENSLGLTLNDWGDPQPTR